jgi:hypothetical protein
MIESIKINWKNCFGIKQLEHEFKFANSKPIHLIYAPNGTMKTSFAKTMKFLSGQSKETPCDKLHQDEESKYDVLVDTNVVSKDSVFVVNGEDNIDSSASFVNFLASSELKSKYDDIYNKLTKEKDALMNKLKNASTSTDCEKEIVEAFSSNKNTTIFNVLDDLCDEVKSGLQLFEFKYNTVFDTKGTVKNFLEENKENLKEYIDNYEKLLSESSLYRSENGFSFGTYQASQLLQNVSDGNFFGVKHKMMLQNGVEVTSHDQLKLIMTEEQERVLNDAKLKKTFEKITKAIDKKLELRDFKKVIETHPDWIVEMLDYDMFRKKVWLGYLAKDDIKPLFDSYIKVYNENKDELLAVLEQAGKQQKIWESIIKLYQARFHVPFQVSISNQRDIILKQEAAKLQFSYVEEGKEPILSSQKVLEDILSRGERRAFVILQFLFEMESRKVSPNDTIVVMDDIADSFDYQNKYAIVEYIKDLAEESSNKFFMLIMTHNYDFYRTISSRMSKSISYMWMVERKSNGQISFEQGQYKGDVFANAFVGKDVDDKIFISMIPYIRNLIEYSKGEGDDRYLLLTSCLHLKDNTTSISESQVIEAMREYTRGKGMKRSKSEKKIYDTIMDTAESIANEQEPNLVLLQNKIVLSIAIRLKAEKYLKEKLLASGVKEEELVVKGNQTGAWTGKYKTNCPDDANITIIERVNMMTPELIHLNSFMYEPLIDMSIFHLIKLYNDCKTLSV